MLGDELRSDATTRNWMLQSVRPRAVRVALLLALVGGSAWVSLAALDSGSLVPPVWPAAGVAAGLFLVTPSRLRWWVLAAGGLLVLVAHLSHGYPLGLAVGFTLSCLVESWLVRRALVGPWGERRPALLGDGDVSRLVAAVAFASAAAALGYTVTGLAAGHDTPLLVAVSVWGTHAAALMLLLPLFLPTAGFAPLAGRRERLILWALTIGTTLAVFASAAVPPVVFVVMPMFAWLAFRGTLREATLLLTLVGVIGAGMTALGVGPIWGLGERYGLAPELVTGVMQLFLLDCGLIMLPLSVAVTQQRMSAARAAADREAMERLVSSATGTAIIAIDTDGRITLFNPGAEALLGYQASQVLGHSPDRFHPVDELARHALDVGTAPSFVDICLGIVDSEQPRRLWRFLRRDGEERTMLMSLSAIPGEDGLTAGYLSTAEDVTEREAAQAALLRAVEHQQSALARLQELDQDKSNFVSSVSHELRTPITSIIGYTELLEDGAGGELTGGQRDLIGRVDRNSRRLLLLVEDLLTLSRIESAELKLEPVITDLRQAVSRAYGALSPQLTHRELTVNLTIPDDPLIHVGDPVQLERMVLNLLTNAVKFTPDGGTVDIVLRGNGELSELVIEDTGLGIPEDEQDRLFTRFFRSTTSTRLAVQGTGLGLSIVKSVVNLHGGDVTIRSANDQGTTVTVTLPRAPRASCEGEPTLPEWASAP